jgi:hypothetical protein
MAAERSRACALSPHRSPGRSSLAGRFSPYGPSRSCSSGSGIRKPNTPCGNPRKRRGVPTSVAHRSRPHRTDHPRVLRRRISSRTSSASRVRSMRRADFRSAGCARRTSSSGFSESSVEGFSAFMIGADWRNLSTRFFGQIASRKWPLCRELQIPYRAFSRKPRECAALFRQPDERADSEGSEAVSVVRYPRPPICASRFTIV